LLLPAVRQVWNDDYYDVLADGVIVGRIMKAAAGRFRDTIPS
jgi:hypothetical protein